MDAKELRIGNWVLSTRTPGWFAVLEIKYKIGKGFLLNEDIPMSCIRPILLSPDILFIYGFEKHANSNEYWTHWSLKNGWCISESHHDEPSANIKNGFYYWGDNYVNVKYMHQLQNLYFSLTGRELRD